LANHVRTAEFRITAANGANIGSYAEIGGDDNDSGGADDVAVLAMANSSSCIIAWEIKVVPTVWAFWLSGSAPTIRPANISARFQIQEPRLILPA